MALALFLLASSVLCGVGHDDVRCSGLADPIAMMQLPGAAVLSDRGKRQQRLQLLGSGQQLHRAKRRAVVGQLTAPMDGEAASCRDHACQYGVFITELLLDFAHSLDRPAQIALVNGGAIRGSLAAGDVTTEMIETVHGFGNNVTFLELPGAVIQELLQNMLAEHGPPGQGQAGSWLQMAGLRFQASWDGQAWVLRNVLVGQSRGEWQPLESNATYSVATNSYIQDGNGGRNVVSSNAQSITETDMNFAALVAQHFGTAGAVTPPTVDDRQLLVVGAEVLGQASGTISGAECRDVACQYGVLLCDELRRYGHEAGYGTQVALYNGGGIRSSIPQGDVTWDSLFEVHPFGNVVSFFTIPGAVIPQLLAAMMAEHGPAGQGASGSFLQVAGLRFEAAWNSTGWVIMGIEVVGDDGTWLRLDEHASYSVASNSYVRFGNGGRAVVSAAAVPLENTGPNVVNVMASLFQSHSPVAPLAADGRECLAGPCLWPLTINSPPLEPIATWPLPRDEEDIPTTAAPAEHSLAQGSAGLPWGMLLALIVRAVAV